MQRDEFIIKICGVTSLEDAQGSIDAGANALGFNFYEPSPRYIAPDRAAGLIAGLCGDFLRVGVFANTTPDYIREVTRAVELDIVQVHGESPIPHGIRHWRALNGSIEAATSGGAEAYVLDSQTPGSGLTFNWAEALGFKHPIIVAGGLDHTNVRDAIATLNPLGVDACSRLESSPGKKDMARVRAFISAALEQRSHI